MRKLFQDRKALLNKLKMEHLKSPIINTQFDKFASKVGIKKRGQSQKKHQELT
jgi:hypothetical protein